MRSVEEILSEAKSKGLILNNLFELRTYPADKHTPCKGTGVYQANFHHSNGHHDYGRGHSAAEALEDALKRAKGLSGPENRPIPKEVKPVAEKESVDMDDLI